MAAFKVYEKDGYKHYQLPIYHEIGVHELVDAVMYGIENGTIKGSKLNSISATAVIDAAKEFFGGYGRMCKYFAAYPAAGPTKELVYQRVCALFPELKS